MSTNDYCNNLSIKTLFESPEGDEINNQYYHDVILRILKKILPTSFWDLNSTIEEKRIDRQRTLNNIIPLITCTQKQEFQGMISFFALSKYSQNSFKFFFDMISRWLTPGHRLNVVLVYATDFLLTDLSNEVYTICEVLVNIENKEQHEEILRHFPSISAEIALGIHSQFYAQRMMEIKGLSVDEKTALIQNFIAFLVQRYPESYDSSVFTEMQHVLVMCRPEFKESRDSRHLSRIIGIQYLFRRSLKAAFKKNPGRSYSNIKLFRTSIKTSNGSKKVLGIIVGLNLLKDQETFAEAHLLKAINHYVPNARAVDQSFFINKQSSEHVYTIYLEVEKEDGSIFTNNEILKLRRELPAELKSRVEYKLHPIFMPRNEEEVMRNLLSVSNQIKYLRDIPQVFISFDEQSHFHLYFTVILARVLKPECIPIPELFQKAETFLEYIHDRTKQMGILRKKYPKEATVFHLKLPKDVFLRADHSIDLYKARQTVVAELSRIVGEVRDYNGGMISKQREVLSDIRKLLTEVKGYNELLLENFFYSLSPVVVRALLDPKAFKTLFLMLLEGLKENKQDGYYLKLYEEPYNVFAMVVIEDLRVKEVLQKAINELNIIPTELATAYVKTNGLACIGYICCAKDPGMKELLFKTIKDTLQSWELCSLK
ncbi:MAG: hypothetical protein H0W88_07120 [Parachlamydiaceae bacterium]|nr:hypothetical protein [Parachlamydiaceae bacterium]